jgi:hypothetical protein
MTHPRRRTMIMIVHQPQIILQLLHKEVKEVVIKLAAAVVAVVVRRKEWKSDSSRLSTLLIRKVDSRLR